MKRKNKLSIKIINLASFALLTLSCVSSINLAMAHENTNNATLIASGNKGYLSVNGFAEHSIPANISTPSIAIESNSINANTAQKQVAKISNLVVNYLRSQKVEKLKTTSINLSPRYEYENNKPKLIEYVANNGISFEVQGDKAGQILDEVVRLGATRIDGINFSASSAEVDAAKNIAIQKAINDAKNKAQSALQALGLQIKQIVGIKIDGANSIQPSPIMMVRAVANDAVAYKAERSPTPIIGGETNVNATVSLDITY